MRGSNEDIPLTPGSEISIKSAEDPTDDFRVMELELNVTPDDETLPVTVTVTFVLEDGSNVTVDVPVSNSALLLDKTFSKALHTDKSCSFNFTTLTRT